MDHGGQKDGFIFALAVLRIDSFKPAAGDIKHLLTQTVYICLPEGGRKAAAGYFPAKPDHFSMAPCCNHLPCLFQRRFIIKQPLPQGRQRADPCLRAGIGAAHLKKLFQAHLRKECAGMQFPVIKRGQLARQGGKSAIKEVTETQSCTVNILPVPDNKIHRRIQRPLGIVFKTETIIKNTGRDAGAGRIGINPAGRPA